MSRWTVWVAAHLGSSRAACGVFFLLRACQICQDRFHWNNSFTWATPPVCWGSVKRMSRWTVWVVSRLGHGTACGVYRLPRRCQMCQGRFSWNNSFTWATPPVCWGSVKRMSRWTVWVVTHPGGLLLTASQGWRTLVPFATLPAWHIRQGFMVWIRNNIVT